MAPHVQAQLQIKSKMFCAPLNDRHSVGGHCAQVSLACLELPDGLRNTKLCVFRRLGTDSGAVLQQCGSHAALALAQAWLWSKL